MWTWSTQVQLVHRCSPLHEKADYDFFQGAALHGEMDLGTPGWTFGSLAKTWRTGNSTYSSTLLIYTHTSTAFAFRNSTNSIALIRYHHSLLVSADMWKVHPLVMYPCSCSHFQTVSTYNGYRDYTFNTRYYKYFVFDDSDWRDYQSQLSPYLTYYIHIRGLGMPSALSVLQCSDAVSDRDSGAAVKRTKWGEKGKEWRDRWMEGRKEGGGHARQREERGKRNEKH